MNSKKGFILSTYVYMLLVFFLLLLTTMLAVMNNTKILSNKLKEQTNNTSGLVDKDFSFVLLGEGNMIIKKGEEYLEPGFKIRTSKGVDLSDSVNIIGSIDVNSPNTYKLTYSATYNGITKKLSRKVTVLDNIASNYITELYRLRKDENGLIKDNTEDENIRYAGSNEFVNNYVEFANANELWRIIGVFENEDSEGNINKRIKIIRNTSIGKYSFDSSDTSVNSGWGINQWGESTYTNGNVYQGADLMRELNSIYLNSQSGYCCNQINQNECSSSSGALICDFTSSSTIKGIGNEFRDMIENIKWNVGAITFSEIVSANQAYIDERSDKNGKVCTNNSYCTDTVNRTTEWDGYVGLPYISDYAYASTDNMCWDNLRNKSDKPCKNNNWLHSVGGGTYWTMSINANSDGATATWKVGTDGYGSSSGHGYIYENVRPTVYLKPIIKIISGDGTEDNPYKLSI